MEIHYIFYLSYLIMLAYNADKFHRSLKVMVTREQALKIPGVNKPKLWDELDIVRLQHKQIKIWCAYRFILLSIIHFLFALVVPTMADLIWSLPNEHLWIPLPSLAISLIFLVVIFWLKGTSSDIRYRKGSPFS